MDSFTETILRQLERGTVPWHPTWPNGLPKDLSTGQEFRGLDLLLLDPAGHRSRYWLTAREVARLGGRLRPGQTGTAVSPRGRLALVASVSDQRPDSNAHPPAGCAAPGTVFNLDQTEGIARPSDDMPPPPSRAFEVAELMLNVLPDPPAIVHAQTRQPAYDARQDCLTLPHLSQFQNADQYYTARFLTLISATGAPHRLGRFTRAVAQDFAPGSFEGLVAELGAAFLCGFAGLRNVIAQVRPASNAEIWAAAVRAEPALLVRAAVAAQHAADYVRGKVVSSPVQVATADPRLPQSCHA